jgi:SRSO17 transposase
MVCRTSGWREELGRFLKPFVARLGHKAQRRMCPLYVSGLIGPGDRKSIAPMAKRLSLGESDQLHHFIAAGIWDATLLETELLIQADRLVGGDDAMLVIDDTRYPRNGTHSVGVAAQYASALGKTANCQTRLPEAEKQIKFFSHVYVSAQNKGKTLCFGEVWKQWFRHTGFTTSGTTAIIPVIVWQRV